ncbi:DUF7657 domain-containing protein [Pseudomonas chlororaphis]|uniref:DUF7657 domain-containing protein n=1 Tax=Pseudomonas chlororaphis TaxID=587753 RepID=A0AAQ0AN19_9PSED|nr:hypothetical protein [Pseudomonas chlororaphis]QNR46180.1 hypothetical protein HLB40_21260 [Pseudomonas chlororaphis]
MLHAERHKWWPVLFFLSCVAVVWVSLGFYQSHYLSGLRIIGDYTTQNLIGFPKEGRGDEWSTYIPMLKQAYLEGFPKKSALAPYFESFDWFIAIPKFDLSLLFLPNQIAYWILPGANALSLQGIYYNLIFVLSVCWLLRNLGVKPSLALSVGAMILFSHFYQVWWTSNFPALGAGILPFAVFTSKLRSSIKFPLFFWSVGHVIFGQIYPPFYVSMAVALLPFLFVARPDLFTRKQIIMAAICAIAAITFFLLMRWDFVKAVSGTSYPGVRVSTGGGVTLRLLLSVLFPTIPVGPSEAGVDSVHEFSLVGTIIPMLFLSLLPFIKWDGFSIRLTIVTVVTLAVMIIYMVVGFPAWLSKITLFYLVPGRRMLIGFSVLVVLYSSVMISHHWHQLRITMVSMACVLFSLIAYVGGVRSDIQSEFYGVGWYWLAPSLLAILGLPIWFVFTDKNKARNIFVVSILIGMVSCQLIVYGSFNPIIKARDILTPADTQLTRDVRALISESDGGGVSVVGNYGHLLRGEGLAVFNAIHLVNVERDIYTNLFMMSREYSDSLFNQFRGISFDNIGAINASGATVIFPANVGGVSFDHDLLNRDRDDDSLVGQVETGLIKQEGRKFELLWKARLLTQIPIGSRLAISTPCVISESWLTRYPLLSGGEDLVDVALRGVAGRVLIHAENLDQAQSCLKALSVSVVSK